MPRDHERKTQFRFDLGHLFRVGAMRLPHLQNPPVRVHRVTSAVQLQLHATSDGQKPGDICRGLRINNGFGGAQMAQSGVEQGAPQSP